MERTLYSTHCTEKCWNSVEEEEGEGPEGVWLKTIIEMIIQCTAVGHRVMSQHIC